MSWSKGRARVPGAKAMRAKVLSLYPICACKGCKACNTRLGCFHNSTEDDHIIPVSEGGSEELDNHQGLCAPCHSVKSSEEAVRGRMRANEKARYPREVHPGLSG